MVATLIEGKKFDGFTPGKEYKYFTEYNIASGELFYNFKADDNGKYRKLSFRDFYFNFMGHYNNEYINKFY